MLPIRLAAQYLGVSVRSLQRWDHEGKRVPRRLPSGARRYSTDQLDAFVGLRTAPATRRAAVYARVSSAKQKAEGNLDRQHKRLLAEVGRRGLVLAMDVAEVASGVNENRRGLARLLKAAANGRFDVLLVEHQDRLARFGYRYLVAAFAASGVEVEVVEDDPGRKEPTAELVDDLLAIVMVFAARIYGKRASVVRSKVKAALAQEAAEAAA